MNRVLVRSRSGIAVDRRLVVASAPWTLFVWGTRVRNIAGDDEINTGERAFGYLVSALFVAAALAIVALFVGRRYERLRALLAVFAIATVGWWTVRSVSILVHEHSWAFRIVHVVLGVISSVLAVAAWRSAAPERPFRAGGPAPERPFRAGRRVRS